MNAADPIDTARLALLLDELRLPAIKHIWAGVRRARRQGRLARRALPGRLAEHEIAERDRRRIERHLAEARLPPGKTLDSFDFDAVPMVSKAQVMALAAGDAWLKRAPTSCCSARPAAARAIWRLRIGLALVENGWRVLFTRTTDLVQRLQVARRELALEAPSPSSTAIDLLILDDLAYVTKDQAETSVLFELISARYERRSLLITANQPFGEWGKVFPDPAMTLAAVDRLVHHATIFEMNVESYRRRTALERKRGPAAARHRDNQSQRLIDAQRQSNLAPPAISDNHPDAATPDSHPDCRRFPIQIAALQKASSKRDHGTIPANRTSGWRGLMIASRRSRNRSLLPDGGPDGRIKKHRKMHGQSADTGIFQYFTTQGIFEKQRLFAFLRADYVRPSNVYRAYSGLDIDKFVTVGTYLL